MGVEKRALHLAFRARERGGGGGCQGDGPLTFRAKGRGGRGGAGDGC
jgi:hypothetical protein